MTLLFELIGVAILILLNAFFVAAEYGLVTARRTRIIELQHQGDRRARDVLRITGDPGRFIAAMQLGVTLTSLGIGALGEATLSREFDKWMSTVPRHRHRLRHPQLLPCRLRRARAEGCGARPRGGDGALGLGARPRVLRRLPAR